MGYDPGGKPRPGQYFDRRHPFVPECGWWMLNEHGGLIARDLLGMNHGTWNGTGSHWAGNAGQFNAVDDYILAATDISALDLNLTISAWVFSRGSHKGGEGHIAEANAMQIYVTDAGLVRFYSGVAYTATQPSISHNQWKHLAFTGNSIGHFIYVDGVLASEANNSDTCTITGTQIYIGRMYSTSAWLFNGFISDVRIYNRTLTAAEVKALYVNSVSGEYAEFPKPVVYFLPPVAEAIAPTSVLYGPLVGPLSGPV